MAPLFVTFDIETAQAAPEDRENGDFALGITCAALTVGDGDIFHTDFFEGAPYMTEPEVRLLVDRLYDLMTLANATLISWNGASFDLRVMAAESGMYDRCAEIVMGHVDLMLCVTFQAGHTLSLEKALVGAGLGGKVHEVTLKSGEKITEMSGALAPAYWAAGEYEAVKTYLRGDVERLYDLARWIGQNQVIRWTSGAGRSRSVPMPKLYTVKELFDLPKPDTSWMTNAPTRNSFVAWCNGGAKGGSNAD